MLCLFSGDSLKYLQNIAPKIFLSKSIILVSLRDRPRFWTENVILGRPRFFVFNMTNIKKFNSGNALLVITSFPQKGGEVAVENAVARYSKLLIEAFPSTQRVVIFCEKRFVGEKQYSINKNILVVPAYTKNSLKFLPQIVGRLLGFGRVKNILLQFEFSVFGGKIILPQVVTLMLILRLLGKNLTVMFHQVTLSLSSLSGHLGLNKLGLKTQFLDFLLSCFYRFSGLLASNIIVHDQVLRANLSKCVNIGKISVVSHGMGDCRKPKKNEVNLLRQILGLSSKQKVVLVFGYNSWYKGTDWVVKAFSNLDRKNIKLVLAGGESPTLKATSAYKRYFSKLQTDIQSSEDVISTGFVPECDVPAMFAIADVVVFPYRARMSASGALALALSYGKAVLVSEKFSENFSDSDIASAFCDGGLRREDISFSMKGYGDFSNKLTRILKDKKMVSQLQQIGFEVTANRKWENAGLQYIGVCTKAVVEPVTAVRSSLAYVQEA